MTTHLTAQRCAPEGLVLRGYAGPTDLDQMVRVFNASNEDCGIDERISVEGLGNWLAHPSDRFDPAHDVVVAVIADLVVGYGSNSWINTSDGMREFRTRGSVHPDWQGRGIGSALLAHNEARIRRVAVGQPDDRPHVFGAWASERQPRAVSLVTRAGYRPARHFFDMLRPTLDEIEVPPMPEGLEVRPMEETRLRQFFDADAEAFADHWGGLDASDGAYAQWLADPDFDQSLLVVAWDGDQVAGGVTNVINARENEQLGIKRGLLASVFVRRAWRRRGLAGALVARSLLLLRERGMTGAWLGVDADNPNGALGLYERAGFAVHLRTTAYRKPMDPQP
ncbi:MAG TPA: GNAT family N-acetyltransferase [Candidatus Saccharimonadales bacterium]|nr:GNAT family N-acetyltransferase [Candidatus Saccharimonadales bacterium]